MVFRAAAFLAAILVAPMAPAADCPTIGSEGAAVADALSGDALRLVDGRTLRLAGVATSQLPLDNPAGTPSGAADAARQGLASIVAGTRVTIAPAGEKLDRYGRTHGYLFLTDGRLLQAVMLEQGWAIARWLPEESLCFQTLLKAERAARQARLGLWASAGPRSANDPYLLGRNGLYELVEGRVVSVGHGTRLVFLDFGRNYRRDFTVMVPPAVADKLAAAGLSASDFANRRVLVRGVIEESGGPAIRLNDPAEIELLDDDQDDVGDER